MFTLWVTLITFILTHVNKSLELWKEKQYHSFVELSKTKCFHRLKYRIGGQIAWCGGVSTYLKNIYFLFTITIRLEVQSVVFLCDMRKRNKSFNRNFPFRTDNNWNVALWYTEFWGKFCRRIYINNYELYSDWILPPLCK